MNKKRSFVDTFRQCELINGDCLDVFTYPAPEFRLVFVDPPYNIGVDYGEGAKADRLPDDEYMTWCKKWMLACGRLLTEDGSLWVLCSDEYADRFGCLLSDIGFHRRNWIIWKENFGVYCHKKFGRCHRHLFYCVLDPKNHVFNADAIRVPSARQTMYHDKRANPKGKIPPDVWDDIPRLCGTFDERIPHFPTQLPLALLERIIACATDPGDVILDPMCGSATSGVAAITLGRRWVGVEKNPTYFDLASERLENASQQAQEAE